MNQTIPRPEYPRPDFARAQWLNLNGTWDFAYDDANTGLQQAWYEQAEFPLQITVPFCYQCPLSGIGDASRHDVIWYRRRFCVPEAFAGQRTMLRFGAVDHTADVWVNGKHCGGHAGGYTPFSLDITDVLTAGENTVVVRVWDDERTDDQLRGKQRAYSENYACWYTPVSGIWQTVWLEAVPALYLDRVKMTPDIEAGMMRCEVYLNQRPAGERLEVCVSFAGKQVANVSVQALNRVFRFDVDLAAGDTPWKLHLWEPDEPNLYDVTFTLGSDQVTSYFGLREIATRDGKVLLNNRPVYQRLILDQGYYAGGLLTAGSDDDFIKDIELARAMGFNGLRMHQKVEDPRFLYWCDKMGMLVWGEMGSAFSFNDDMVEENTRAWQEAIARDYNHPSIIVWTLMNESWGVPHIANNERQQAHTMALYYQTKAYDPTRLAISNDGWEHTVSDILTFHDYRQDGEALTAHLADPDWVRTGPVASVGNALNSKYLMANGFEAADQPILFSECCGTAYANDEGWGYGGGVTDVEGYVQRYRELLAAIYSAKYLTGFCVTQLTDVEQEVNGIATMQRQPKVDPARFAKIILGQDR